jgi:biotin transport system substrate-specific component
VPITLQTIAIGLIATVLKTRETFLAVLIYLILGFIGLPVFSGGRSGIGVLFGPTGGFLVAFLVMGPIISYFLHKFNYQALPAFITNIIGHLLMLVIGAVWLKYFAHVNWSTALNLGFTPFILIEIIKAIIVTLFGLALIKALSHTNPYFKKANI